MAKGPSVNDFEIYELKVGAGALALCPLPGRTGAFSPDFESLMDWQPSMVLTLVEESELKARDAESLGAELTRRDVDWRHLPMPDFGTPKVTDAEVWTKTITAAQFVLADRGRVLVHCMGGCGRSGMIVLRLMIAAGEAPDVALARLRKVRSCAVETAAQMLWATSL